MANDKARFTPVKGLEEVILSLPYHDGYLYFAEDSRKIYLDADNKPKILMGGGGNSGIYYGTKVIEADAEGYEIFVLTDLENAEELPSVDDLILNMPNGAFYRVMIVNKDSGEIEAQKLTVSGGGGGTVYSDKAKIDKIEPASKYLINGSSSIIKVKGTPGKDEEGNYFNEQLTVYWSLSEKDTVTGVVTEYAHGEFPVEPSITEDKWEDFEYGTKARNSATNILKMYCKGSSSTESRSFEYTFYTTKLELLSHTSFTANTTYGPNDVIIYNTVVGDVEKFIFYYFDNQLLNEGGTHLASNLTEPSFQVPSNLCTHGPHTVRIELYQSVNNKVDLTSSAEPIEMEIAVVEEGHNEPVIWLGAYQPTYYQYDNIKVPFNVYDPLNSLNTEVRFFKDSTKLSTRTVARSNEFSVFEIVNGDLNEQNHYYIRAGENELEVEREITFKLEEDPNRVNMKTITNGLVWSFDAKGRSNSESATNRQKGLNGENIGTFKDFNWYSNGWKEDENNSAVLRISNNAEYDYPLGKTTLASTSAGKQSCTFEFQFQVRNVQDYAQIVHNITRYKGLTDERYKTYPTWVDNDAYAAFQSKSYNVKYIPATAFVEGETYYIYDNSVKDYVVDPTVTAETFDADKHFVLNKVYNAKVFDNYDAFLQWYLPAYWATLTPEEQDKTPPDYDAIEYARTEKILATEFAAGSYYDGERGILLGAQDALFTNGTNVVNVSYVEDKVVNLTAVYDHNAGTQDGANMLMSIYLNGVLTGVARSTLIDGSGAPTIWEIGDDTLNMVFNSKYCDFDLYKIRVYNRALTMPEILTNYSVDLKDTLLYDETTQLASLNRDLNEYQLSYNEMIKYNQDHPDAPMMPYIVFDTEEASDGDALPYSKATPIEYVKMTFVNPSLDRAYVTGRLGELAAAAGMTVDEYYIHHCPSWTADKVSLSVQGTSSEFYPRRNYKAKTQVKLDNDGKRDDVNGKKSARMRLNAGPFADRYAANPDDKEVELKYFYYDNNSVGTNKYTLKIDYMESSGTYNMGFANLVANAYIHHPLWYYNQKKAFCVGTEGKTTEIPSPTYDASKTYNYYNHKSNIDGKTLADFGGFDPTNPDHLAAFKQGPMSLEVFLTNAGLSATGGKVLGGPKAKMTSIPSEEEQLKNIADLYEDGNPHVGLESVNKWFEYVPGSQEDAEVENVTDLRTSVQGIPTLAFHRKKDKSIIFIGQYNMLTDKGSDEVYGFAPLNGNLKQKYVLDDKGELMVVEDAAECWEFENNSRGFCSFRDPNQRYIQDIGDEPGDFFNIGTWTANDAPMVADYFEYRYNPNDDALDVLYDIANKKGDADSIKAVSDAYGVDISDPTIDPVTGKTQGILNGAQALYKTYSNWERAVKWVYSTDTESVPSMGTYQLIRLGTAIYAPNTYYLMTTHKDDDGNIITDFVLDDRAEFDIESVYYERYYDEAEKAYSYKTITLVADADHLYHLNKFYILASDGSYILDPATVEAGHSEMEAFNATTNYYQLIVDESHLDAKYRLPEAVTYGTQTYNYDTKEYRNAKFVNELENHFNLDYLATYFVMTEVFECYDSRGKNAMFASWGPQTAGGDYIWFPIFYDIDTQLGINNTGIPSFEYYVDATENGCFSTNDSLLWNQFYKNFKSIIIQKYRQLKNKKSTFTQLDCPPLASIDRIEKWYTTDPTECGSLAMEGRRPLVAQNLGEYYKYISITNSKIGYQNRTGGDDPISYDNGTFFYALQGDRSLSRQQFLTNRINYLDSWLNQGNYERGGNNVALGRIAANSPSNTSDKWIEVGGSKNSETTLEFEDTYWLDDAQTKKRHMFDAEYWIDMNPVRNSYVTVGTDAANFPSLKYTGETVTFKTPDLENGVRKSGGYHEQLFYIYGIDQMKSLGDMSTLYWTEFKIEGKAAKMTELLLGYDGKDEEGNTYFNKGINMYGIHASNSATDNGGMPLLKKVNLSNITFNDASPTYSFASCDKLEDFRAIGSNISGLTFAEGNNLSVLYLPRTITDLSLTEASKLTNIVTTYRQRDDSNNIDVYPGLYIEGLTDKQITDGDLNSRITKLSLTNDHLGYDSYKLLNLYYHARTGAAKSQILMTNVDWCPYKQLDEGTEYVEADKNLYFVDSGHYTFAPYTYNAQQWALQVKNGEVFRLDTSIDKSQITSFELLENLHRASNFVSTTGDPDPTITGIIYIDADEMYKETDIKKDIEAFYPQLKIFVDDAHVQKAYSAKFVLAFPDGTYQTLATDKIDSGWFKSPRQIAETDTSMSSISINKLIDNKDFYGWSYANPKDNKGNPIVMTSDFVEDLAEDDPEWYLEGKHYISISTDIPGSPAVPDDAQFNNWTSQSLESGVYDYTFYALFAVHKYIMTFYQGDNTTILGTLAIDAGQPVTPILQLPYKDDSGMEATQTWKFTGVWTSSTGRVLDGMKANSDYTFYPSFVEASVYDNPLDPQYLDFVTDNYKEDNFGDASYNVNGYRVSPKEGVSFKGKITIPATYNNLPVVKIANFSKQTELTHIFFERNSQGETNIREVKDNCFWVSRAELANKLTHFEFVDSLRRIGANSFRSIPLTVYNLGNNVYEIGKLAFADAFTKTPGLVIRLGSEITSLDYMVFSYLKVTSDTKLIIGDSTRGCKLDLANFYEYSATDGYCKTAGSFGEIEFWSSKYNNFSDYACNYPVSSTNVYTVSDCLPTLTGVVQVHHVG